MSRQRPAPFGLVALVGLWTAPPAPAADWPVPRGPSREPAPFRYDAALWKQVPRAFLDDSPACLLYAGRSYLVEADGTVEAVCHEVTRLNSRKAVERLGEYRGITYDPAFQTLTLNEARVLKANGRAVPVEPRHLQLRDVATDFQAYDHDKQLVISFPDLEPGDCLEVKWTVRGKNPEHQGHFFTRYAFGDDHYPAARDELRVRLPKGKELKHAAAGGKLEPAVEEDKEYRLYRWQVTDRPPLPADEDLPPREFLRLQVACSTFASWDEVGKWKEQVRAGCWECTPEVRKVVEEVTKGLKTPREKARALTYWVRGHVRYVQVGAGHDYTPHPPAAVLANRFGDCKDQTQLLAVMLREAGVPVALATLGQLGDGQVLESLPSPWGTHALLLVTLDGNNHWIDTTTPLAAWDFLPRGDRDRLCYVTDDKGLRLLRTPPLAPEDNRVEQVTHLSVLADGTSRAERQMAHHGSAAVARRDDWLEVPPGERRRVVAAELQDANSRARLTRLVIDEPALRDFDRPVTAHAAFETRAHLAGDPVREGSITDSRVWNRLLAYHLDYDRKAPLDLRAPFESRHRYVVRLAPALRFDGLPKSKMVESKWGTFRLTVRPDPDDPRHLDLDFHTRLEEVRVAPADFEAFRKFHEDVARHYRVWLSVRPTQDPADAPALEAWLALAPGDGESALVLARLYRQHGKLADARRVLAWACFHRPDDKALGELAVQVAGNFRAQEAAYRELVRRFPGEPKYAVGLGSVLVTLGEYGQAREVLAPVAAKAGPAARGQAHFQLARSWFFDHKPAEALEHLAAAERADADSVAGAAACQFRARVYEKLGRPDDALRAHRQALQSEPESAVSLAAAVRLSLALKRPAEALDYLRRYTLAVGDDVDGLAAAADFHLRLGRYDDAFDLAARARERRFHARAQAVLGLVYLHRGDHARAVFHLERADADALVLEGLMRGYVALGRLGDAEDQAERAVQIDEPTAGLVRASALVAKLLQRRNALLREARPPKGKADVWRNAVGHYACAEHAYREGRRGEEVEGLVKEVWGEDVEYGPAYALRGLLAAEKGRLTKALADAERAVALSPEAAAGYYVRGRVRLERGAAGALADLEKAAGLGGRQDAAVLHWLAAAQFQLGRRGEALATQREAVKLRPDDPALAEQLREFEAQGPDDPQDRSVASGDFGRASQ